MILADTSLWIEHFRKNRDDFADRLIQGEVLSHPLVIGELACGSFKNRNSVLQLLNALPQALECSHAEVRVLIERHELFSSGLGIVDMHLLGSARLSHAKLWTLDRRLADAAVHLHVAYTA